MPDTICAYERHCEIPKQFSSYLKSLSGVYKNKLINQNKRIKELTKDEIDQISSFLRPDFEKVPSLHMQIKETSQTIETLTQEQYEKIDGIIDNERCVIIGGAGTGKTFLAMAAALYHAARNEKVLITTRSPYLANYLRSNRNTDNIDIMDIQQIIDKKLDIKFDVIIIDEGQDLCQLDKIQIF